MKLYKHQQHGIKVLQHNKSYALFWDMGTGKTLTVLKYFETLPSYYKLLVICPLNLIEGAWGEDIQKFTDLKFWNLHKTKKEPKDYRVLLINFESVWRQKTIKILDPIIKSRNCVCCIDESSKMKNPKSKVTKYLMKISHFFDRKILLSGTPAPNDESEYYSQISFLDPNIFSSSYWNFKNKYFVLYRGNHEVSISGGNRTVMQDLYRKGFKYKLNPNLKDEFYGKIKEVAHLLKKSSCLDLPPYIEVVRHTSFNKAHDLIYKNMKRNCFIELKENYVTADMALKKLMKLRQIASGFIIDEDGNSVTLQCCNAKYKLLQEIIEEIGEQQCIIWGTFHYEIEEINKLLGCESKCLYGKTQNKNEVIEEFKQNKFKYLIAHPRSAGHGLTFNQCLYQIFFSYDYSYELFEQAKARNYRAGQGKSVTYIYLILKNSIDEIILDVLKRKGKKQEIFETFLKNKL